MVNGLAERLKEQRHKRNLSQKEVANILHVSTSIISNYERGERSPSIENLVTLATLYHCSTDYLLGIENKNKQNIDISMLNDRQIELLQNFLFGLNK